MMATEDERTLVEAARKDPSRFAELYGIHFERVYAYIARRVRDRTEAQDLTSDVFHRALAGLPQYEWRGAPFAAWLFRIAGNAVADHFERLGRQREVPADPDPEPARIEDAERRARLYRCVDDLPADQRRVVLLRFTKEKSIRDIAQELGRSEGAVKQLQFRALQGLRARMGGSND
jgi:RNA polymerase sigma-70 factor (ECF subfamily)